MGATKSIREDHSLPGHVCEAKLGLGPSRVVPHGPAAGGQDGVSGPARRVGLDTGHVVSVDFGLTRHVGAVQEGPNGGEDVHSLQLSDMMGTGGGGRVVVGVIALAVRSARTLEG